MTVLYTKNIKIFEQKTFGDLEKYCLHFQKIFHYNFLIPSDEKKLLLF